MAEVSQQNPDVVPGMSRRKRVLRLIGLIFVVLAVLLTLYGAIVYLAWQEGQALRVENAQEALQEQLANQINLAQEDIDAGNFALALRRLDWVLEQSPGYPGAAELQQQAQGGLNARLTPRPTATATATPLPHVTPAATPEPNEAFTQLRKVMNEGDWETAVQAISAFQAEFPNYQRRETDALLYEAYINLGLSLLPGKQVELGLFYLDQAQKLGDLPQDVLDQREWAEVYLLGIGYYGVNWDAAVFYFRGLCQAAPFYQNACDTLGESLIAYGDQYAAALDWCPARGLYGEALTYDDRRAVVEKRNEAAEQCALATPTPDADVITGTETISNNLPFIGD